MGPGLLLFSQLRNISSHNRGAEVEEEGQLLGLGVGRPPWSSWPGALASCSFTWVFLV